MFSLPVLLGTAFSLLSAGSVLFFTRHAPEKALPAPRTTREQTASANRVSFAVRDVVRSHGQARRSGRDKNGLSRYHHGPHGLRHLIKRGPS